jgi:hypothetical protein
VRITIVAIIGELLLPTSSLALHSLLMNDSLLQLSLTELQNKNKIIDSVKNENDINLMENNEKNVDSLIF